MIDQHLLRTLRIVADSRRRNPPSHFAWTDCANYIATQVIHEAVHDPRDWKFYEDFYQKECEPK